MRRFRSAAFISAFGLCLACGSYEADAAEFGFSIYPVGTLTFGAGATPPEGLYVTQIAAYYQGSVGGSATLGRVTAIDLNAKFFTSATNFLYVPEAKLFGGNLGFSLTLPVGYLDLTAQALIGSLGGSRTVRGGGLGDIMMRGQLGWTYGAFSHTLYVTGWLPTGRYDPTFAPNIGLNRPAADLTWGFSYLEPTTMLEFSAAAGVTFNARNTATDYQTGLEGHLEWAIGKKIGQQLTLGVAGYHYRQLTGDSGSGAILGSFMGRNNGIGPGLTYITQIGGHLAILNLRHYWEYEAVRHFGGALSTASVTVRF